MDNYANNNDSRIKHIIKGLIFSVCFTAIFLLILSAILVYTNFSEQYINISIILITGVSILIGSSITNIKLKKNGMLNGAIVGGIYLLMLYLISSICSGNFMINTQTLIVFAVGIGFGILGGVIGVNLK